MENKLLILKMLEEGKITSEEALKLLESVKEKTGERKKDEKFSANKKLNKTISDFSKKAEEFAEKFGPDFIAKVENVSSDFADAAVKFADKMVSYLNTGINSFDKYNSITKDYTRPVKIENSVLHLKTKNIRVYAKDTDKEDLSLKLALNIYEDTIDVDKYISLEAHGDNISFTTDLPSDVWGKLEVEIPKSVDKFFIETANSKINIKTLNATEINCITSNDKIEIDKCHMKELFAKTNNAKIQINKTIAKKAVIETTNAGIELEESSFDELKSQTSNNNIYMDSFSLIDAEEAKYDLQTTNGKIKISLPKKKNIAYKVNSKTSLGNINLLQLDNSYNIERKDGNMQGEAIITSNDFESSDKRIVISASTTNSSITVMEK